PRVFAARLSGSNSRTLPVLQLRRLHADSVRKTVAAGVAPAKLCSRHGCLYSELVLFFAPNARRTQRRIGYSNDRHAYGYEPQWRHFWWMGDLTNGPGERNSCSEKRPNTRCH